MKVRQRQPGEFLSAVDRLLESGLEGVYNAMKAARNEGGNINETISAEHGYLGGRTLMHQIVELCCGRDHGSTDGMVFAMLDWMLDNDANINAREQAGYHPLQVALYQQKELRVIR